jgi:transcriptional regulator with XRE-family HTH domain
MTRRDESALTRPRAHFPARATRESLRLKRWRLSALYTQAALGERLGLSAWAVSAIEQGRRPITPDMSARWRSATRVGARCRLSAR